MLPGEGVEQGHDRVAALRQRAAEKEGRIKNVRTEDASKSSGGTWHQKIFNDLNPYED